MKHPHSYIIFDLETSGLGPGTAKIPKNIIMEFAAIVLDENLKEVERTEFLIKPYGGNPIYQQQALDTHNIPVQRTKDEGISSKEAVLKIADLFKRYSSGARKKPVIVGHNIKGFDNKFLKVLFEFEKKEFEKIYELRIDTLQWSHIKYGHTDQMVDFKLGTTCAREDVAIIGAHRAMNDVEANTKLLIKYLTDLRLDSNNIESQKIVRTRDKFYF